MAEHLVEPLDPSRVRRIHLLGIAGAGMGSFAGLLQAAGFEVTGSDENVYPPMSEVLGGLGIRAMSPYRAANLDEARPDLVIVGNVIRRENPEADAVRARGLPHTSFPAALAALFLESRHSVVVAGTHGKTTTTALLAHGLVEAGRDPSFLVGGVAQNFGASFRLGRGSHFVIEGDEYDTAYFDKGPKFLHYRPRTAIVTSVEFDHADIFDDLAHYESAFARFVEVVHPEGLLVVCASYPKAVALARRGRARVETYAVGAAADWTASRVEVGPSGAGFEVLRCGRAVARLSTALSGRHNVENALGAFAVATALGLSADEIARGAASFLGVRRRQELRGEVGGVAMVDDFAHHPTAVRETVAAVAARFPGRRLWAVFEPRSNTARRNTHQADYAAAFAGAARAIVAVPQRTDRVPQGEALDVERLAREVTLSGVPAEAVAGVEAIVQRVAAGVRPGDVVLAMSNGSFGGFLDRLVAQLAARGSHA